MKVKRQTNVELLKSLERLSDSSVAVGFFPEDTYPETGIPVAQVASNNEFGFTTIHPETGNPIDIPPRPFMRTTVHEKEQGWADSLTILLGKNRVPLGMALNQLGEIIVGDIKAKILKIAAAGGNAKYTIRKKGFDAPLIETSRMLNSVKHKTVVGGL